MPDVLLLCEYPTLNGGERSMLSTLAGLRAAGFVPAVAAPPEGPLAGELAARGVELLPFNCRALDGTRIPQPRLRERLAALLRRRRPDLLHANSLSMGRLAGPVTAELGVPSLAHLRDIVGIGRQAAADLNRHRRLLAVSRAVRDFHVAQGVAPEKTFVLYNGVDLDEFSAAKDRPNFRDCEDETVPLDAGLPPDATRIATIGQIGLRKGQDVLLRAAGIVAERWPNAHFLIVGERNSEKDESRRFEQALHAAAESERLAGRVHFLGRRDDVPRLLGALTLLVHPARQEPLGRVLLEAAAAGLPIVATDVGGTREIFPPASGAALLVPPDDPAALARAIEELLGDAARRCRLGAAAHFQVQERFQAKRMAIELANHYHDVLRD